MKKWGKHEKNEENMKKWGTHEKNEEHMKKMRNTWKNEENMKKWRKHEKNIQMIIIPSPPVLFFLKINILRFYSHLI